MQFINVIHMPPSIHTHAYTNSHTHTHEHTPTHTHAHTHTLSTITGKQVLEVQVTLTALRKGLLDTFLVCNVTGIDMPLAVKFQGTCVCVNVCVSVSLYV
jgi:hypothetical protein